MNCLNENKQTDAIFLEFSKAFDRVATPRLFCKLSHYGIRGSMLAWIQEYLNDRSQSVNCVILDGISSCNLPVSSGVPQGTVHVLAPLLFLCFVNDIPEFVQCKISLYADDILLYSEINSPDDYLCLQADIDNLFSWSEQWQLHFNPAKCEFLQNY